MQHADVRGNPCATGNSAAQASCERALWRLMTFDDTPLADLDSAMRHDPSWALPHVIKAGYLLSLTEPGLRNEAAAHLEQALALSAKGGTPREQAHLAAVQQVLDGRWAAACRSWDALLVEHPRDALALQWVHHWDFHRGDSAALRQRPARCLPEWDEHDPLFPCVLALHAFGLEECNLHPQAEEAARRALAMDARLPWAVHAVAHVMEMQGRHDEGSAWLRQHQPRWAAGNGLACHLWWHKALFRLEAMDIAGVLRLVDNHMSGDTLQITLQRLDAAALLWRLHLLGEDVTAACAGVLDGWALDDGAAGYYAFNDLHAVLAMLGAGQLQRAEHWVARCAERALTATDAGRSNHAVAREVGLPLMRGLLALARGDAGQAAEQLFPLRAQARALGGSHAQRDLIDLTALAAAVQGRRHALGRALLNERRMAKPPTPLTRHWQEALGASNQARA